MTTRARAEDGIEHSFERAMRASVREDARKAKRRARASVPRNSLGQPWQGETWACTRCGAGGDDRDDVAVPGCTAGPHGADRQWHELAFAPEAHHAAIVARRSA